MNSVEWLYRYVFRGIGWLVVGAMATIVALPVLNSCSGRTDRREDARQKEETRKILKRMHENADEEIRKYRDSTLQKRETKEKGK